MGKHCFYTSEKSNALAHGANGINNHSPGNDIPIMFTVWAIDGCPKGRIMAEDVIS